MGGVTFDNPEGSEPEQEAPSRTTPQGIAQLPERVVRTEEGERQPQESGDDELHPQGLFDLGVLKTPRSNNPWGQDAHTMPPYGNG